MENTLHELWRDYNEKLRAYTAFDLADFSITEQKAIVALLIDHPNLLRKSERFFANGDSSVTLHTEVIEVRVNCRREGIEAEKEGPFGTINLLWEAEHEVWVVQS